jgi:cytochrome c551/c552
VNAAPNQGAARWPVFIVIGFFILITALFVIAFVSATESEMAAASQPTAILTADTYFEQVNNLLQNASAENGALLVEQYGCTACHRLGVSSDVAPTFEGIAERASTRRRPLSAADYLYESIIHPAVFVVEGYQPGMPQNYPDRLSDQELGDIIAYLLTPTAH